MGRAPRVVRFRCLLLHYKTELLSLLSGSFYIGYREARKRRLSNAFLLRVCSRQVTLVCLRQRQLWMAVPGLDSLAISCGLCSTLLQRGSPVTILSPAQRTRTVKENCDSFQWRFLLSHLPTKPTLTLQNYHSREICNVSYIAERVSLFQIAPAAHALFQQWYRLQFPVDKLDFWFQRNLNLCMFYHQDFPRSCQMDMDFGRYNSSADHNFIATNWDSSETDNKIKLKPYSFIINKFKI